MGREPASPVERARGNRAAPSSAEERLWSLLRDRRLRYKFRRQHPIGKYVTDFACPSMKLVIEVDGESHDQPEQRAFDTMREEYLRERGWKILRIKNYEVFQSISAIEDAIWKLLEPED